MDFKCLELQHDMQYRLSNVCFLKRTKKQKIIIIVTHDNTIKKYLSKQIVVGEINE